MTKLEAVTAQIDKLESVIPSLSHFRAVTIETCIRIAREAVARDDVDAALLILYQVALYAES
jgi:hypothetical protein